MTPNHKGGRHASKEQDFFIRDTLITTENLTLIILSTTAFNSIFFHNCTKLAALAYLCFSQVIAGSLESAYSLIWGSHKIWGKGGGDTFDLL